MSSLYQTIFSNLKPVTIGAVHFPPLLGYDRFAGLASAKRNAKKDVEAFIKGGVDALIFENNYDIPHTEWVDPAVALCLYELIQSVRPSSRVPVGVSVLWNDYKTALSIAKLIGAQFVRVPVFVDTVKTACGVIEGHAKSVIEYRKTIQAEHVAIFTDIHVKHAELLSSFSLTQSAKRAVAAGSDGLILTGNWTGQAPDLAELARVRKAVGDFPLLIGSGANVENITSLFEHTNAAIVSTSLKRGGSKQGEVNVKGYEQRIDVKRVRAFCNAYKK